MAREVLFQPAGVASNPFSGGQRVGAAIGRLGAQLDQQHRRAQAESLSGAVADMRVNTARLSSEFEDDPVGFENAHKAYFDGAVQGVPGGVRERYQEASGRDRELALVGIREKAQKRLEEREAASALEGFNGLRDQAIEAARVGDLEFIDGSRADIADLLSEMGLSETKIVQALDKFDDDIFRQGVLGSYETSDDKAGFIEAFSKRKDIPTEEQNQLIGVMQGMQRQQNAIDLAVNAEELEQAEFEKAAKASNLSIEVDRGQASYGEIDQAFFDETITGKERASMYAKLDGINKAKGDSALAMADVVEALEGGTPLDPKNPDHQKALDKIARAAGDYSELDAGGKDAVADLVQRAGIVPDSFRSYARRHLRHSDPEAAANAADFIDRIENKSPQALSDLPKDERAFARLVNESISAGMDPQTAVELTNERVFNVTAAQRAERSTKFVEDFKSDNADALDDEFGGTFSPDVPVGMQTEYDLLTEQYYTRTGEIDSARELALADVNGTWAETDIEGNSRYMKYPPEKMYDIPADVLKDQLGADTLDQEVRLIADGQTARSAKGTASWLIQVRREDGMWEPLRDGNVPFRWMPDAEAYQAEVEKEVFQDQEVKIMRRRAVREAYESAYGDPLAPNP